MTLRMQVTFPTGYYHATPWGRHVNEGVVEWPPSPWRLCRALLSTGFRKLGWSDVPDEARSLLEKLSAELPVFHLPDAASGHTRHYMPVYKGSPNKVIDAFVWLGRGGSIGIEWPVELAGPEVELLDRALEALNYLGRAESWVEARRVELFERAFPHECSPSEGAPGARWERLPRLAPMATTAYRQWRNEAVERQRAVRLEEKMEAAQAKGKKPPTKRTKKDLQKIESQLPPDLVDAMLVDTSSLQKQGWNQPPGSRWVSYWLPEGVLAPRPSTRRSRPRTIRATTALLALAPDTEQAPTLPPLRDALRRGEQVHQALLSRAESAGGESPQSLTGKGADGAPLRGHQHAHVIPLSLEARHGRPVIDHLLVHAPMGFEEGAVRALERLDRLYAKNLPRVFVTLVGVGVAEDFRSSVPLLRPSKRWKSFTPFVPPRYLKPRGKNSLEGQVRAELASRGLPAPHTIEVEVQTVEGTSFVDASHFWPLWQRRGGRVRVGGGGAALQDSPVALAARWRHFRRERDKKGAPQPPVSAGFGLRLSFEDEASALRTTVDPRPMLLALGYGAHFGLGVFAPCHEEVDSPLGE